MIALRNSNHQKAFDLKTLQHSPHSCCHHRPQIKTKKKSIPAKFYIRVVKKTMNVDIVDISPAGVMPLPSIALLASLRPGEPNAPELPHDSIGANQKGVEEVQLLTGVSGSQDEMDVVSRYHREQVLGESEQDGENIYICNIAKSIDCSSADSIHLSHGEERRQDRTSLVLTALRAISCISSSGIEVTSTLAP
jgi:hypothetical protein